MVSGAVGWGFTVLGLMRHRWMRVRAEENISGLLSTEQALSSMGQGPEAGHLEWWVCLSYIGWTEYEKIRPAFLEGSFRSFREFIPERFWKEELPSYQRFCYSFNNICDSCRGGEHFHLRAALNLLIGEDIKLMTRVFSLGCWASSGNSVMVTQRWDLMPLNWTWKSDNNSVLVCLGCSTKMSKTAGIKMREIIFHVSECWEVSGEEPLPGSRKPVFSLGSGSGSSLASLSDMGWYNSFKNFKKDLYIYLECRVQRKREHTPHTHICAHTLGSCIC